MKKIKIKNPLTYAIALSVIVMLLGTVVYYFINEQTKTKLLESFGQRSFALASFTMSEIDRTIQFNIREVGLMAVKVADSETLAKSNEAFSKLDDINTTIKERDESWISRDQDSRDLIDSVVLNELSRELRRDYPYKKGVESDSHLTKSYPEIFITNKYGANVAATNETTDYYQADEHWWQTAKNNGIFVGDVELDESAGVYSIDIAYPVYNDRELIGVIKVSWDIREIIDLLRTAHSERKDRHLFGETTEVVLLNTDLRVIYTSKENVSFWDNLTDTNIGLIANGSITNGDYIISEGDTDNADKVALFITYAQSSGFDNFDGLDWILIFEQDLNEVLSPISNGLFTIAPIIFGFIIVIASIVYIYTKQIEKEGELKEEFISIASHQLKTPISSNKWIIETIRDEKRVPKKIKEWLSDISENTNSMGRLVNDFLSLSRLESGRLEINPENIDIIQETQKIISDLESYAHEHDIKISFETSKDIKNPINVDKSIFNLVLNNILTNAIKYSKEKGEVKVTVDEKDSDIVFSVKDSGLGIPKHTQSHIFEKYYRADNVKEHSITGTGIGLHVVYHIVKGIGGNIWFDSIEDEGTTFYFSIPTSGMPKKKIKAY